MPQPVRVYHGQPGAPRGVEDDLRDPASGERPVRCMHPDEHAATLCRARAAPAQIRRDRGTDVGRQRQPFGSVTLTQDRDLAVAPVDVLQPKTRDFAGAQPQPRQQHHDRVVTPTGRSAPITAGEQPAQLTRFQTLRQARQPPTRHRRDGRR